MLSSLFTTIQSTLGLSKNFLISFVVPLLIFFASSAAVFSVTRAPYRDWIPRELPKETGWFYVAGIIGFTALAYVFSALATPMRELLEGQHLLESSWFRAGMHKRQRKQLDKLSKRYRDYSKKLRRLNDSVSQWKTDLSQALKQGPVGGTCVYPAFGPPLAGSRQFRKVCKQRLKGQCLNDLDLRNAVRYLAGELQTKSTTGQPDGPVLEEDYRKLREVLEYAQDRDAYERIFWFKRRQFYFPGVFKERKRDAKSSPSNMLAVTGMGNIARTIRSYGLNQYSLDLDVLWSRLQTVVQQKKEFYGSLQDAKTQLDFLISLWWLTTLFWIAWGVVLPLTFDAEQPLPAYVVFAAIALAGPVLSWIWYRLACQSYSAFADLMRTSVDLYRFELLDSLHLRRPSGKDEENRLWLSIVQATAFEDSTQNFEYKAESK